MRGHLLHSKVSERQHPATTAAAAAKQQQQQISPHPLFFLTDCLIDFSKPKCNSKCLSFAAGKQQQQQHTARVLEGGERRERKRREGGEGRVTAIPAPRSI